MASEAYIQGSYTLVTLRGEFGPATSPAGVLNTAIHKDTNVTGDCNGSVHDIDLDKTLRLVILYLTIVFGVVGFVLVLTWMACNRRLSPRINRLSRVNTLILNLAFADISVILLAVLPQLVWEYVDREWTAGPVMCRAVKFFQSFSMMASNYILVVIALDRHRAIRSPLKESLTVWKYAGIGWAAAALLSSPMLGLFHVNFVNGTTRCENVFRDKPLYYRQVWTTFVTVVVFVVPLIILVVCYTRIFMKISRKASQSFKNNRRSVKPGEVRLQSTHSTSLPKAKVKTLKMTFVIILAYILCGCPYMIIETIMSFGGHCSISKVVYALFAGMAACNSAANPFVFLYFNVNCKWFKDVKRCKSSRRGYSPSRGCIPSSPPPSTVTTHFIGHPNCHENARGSAKGLIKLDTMSNVE